MYGLSCIDYEAKVTIESLECSSDARVAFHSVSPGTTLSKGIESSVNEDATLERTSRQDIEALASRIRAEPSHPSMTPALATTGFASGIINCKCPQLQFSRAKHPCPRHVRVVCNLQSVILELRIPKTVTTPVLELKSSSFK
eukprot:773831-Amorphochlora_amoeboformis.AAC.1